MAEINRKELLLAAVQGESAYQIWLKNGNTGTEEDFLKSLRCSVEDLANAIKEANRVVRLI